VSNSEIINRISLGGTDGVKKVELRKEFQNTHIDDVIESLLKSGEIVMDKKGTAHYLWQADNYLEYLLTTDTKFKLLYNGIEEMKILLENSNIQSAATADSSKAQNRVNDTLNISEGHGNSLNHVLESDLVNSLDKGKFRQEFDLALRRHSNSSGWVPLSTIKEDMKKKYDLKHDEFYAQVEEMTNEEYDAYELSTGGVEGITVRGLLHGFVRCI
jgi:predicted nucleic-acid-binding protein